MDNPEEKERNTNTKLPVSNNLIYPNPNTTSEPAVLSMEAVENVEQPPITHKTKKWYSIVSFIFTLIPILLCGCCLIYYYINRKPDVVGTDFTSLVFSYMIVYYLSIGIPMAGCAIGFGIKGLKNELPQLAKFSLFLKICYILVAILFMCGVIQI